MPPHSIWVFHKNLFLVIPDKTEKGAFWVLVHDAFSALIFLLDNWLIQPVVVLKLFNTSDLLRQAEVLVIGVAVCWCVCVSLPTYYLSQSLLIGCTPFAPYHY